MAANLLTLLWIISFGAGLLGRFLNGGYETGANILIFFGVVGLAIQIFQRRSTDEENRPAADKDDAEAREPRDPIEAELVALIDEWRALRPSEFTDAAHAPYSFLFRRTSEFLETVFGRGEAQRFEDNGGEKPEIFNQKIDLRIRALCRLRDTPDRWHPLVDMAGLRRAVIARKEIDYGSAVLIAGSPRGSLLTVHRPTIEQHMADPVMRYEPAHTWRSSRQQTGVARKRSGLVRSRCR